MLIIDNVADIHGKITQLVIPHAKEKSFDAHGLMALPAVIDPHVHFRTPGLEYKEDWRTAAKAAIRGGCTMVFDMPNTLPPTITKELLQEKKAIIDRQLLEVGIPLHYELFFGADKHHLDQIPLVKQSAVGIKVFMGCSTGNLVIDDDESLHAVFSLAAENQMIVAVHAEDEHLIRERKQHYHGDRHYAIHSQLRDIEVATRAVEKAIALTRRYGTRLYILHVSSREEIELIRSAKKEGLPVFAETTPHHLFFDTSVYDTLQGKAVVNPPLRDAQHHEALFAAIQEGLVDTIGSDHAPHTVEEKKKPYGECPSGMPGIEFTLPLLLNAYHEGKIDLTNIVSLTSKRAREIFSLPTHHDWVLVDLEKASRVTHTHSKCGWTPYQDKILRGWVAGTVLNGMIYLNS